MTINSSLSSIQVLLKIATATTFFFYQNIDYNIQTNNLQLTKNNQNVVKLV